LLNSKQLFNGKNHYNNNISINLKKNTVDFKPIKMKSYMPYLHFLSLHLYVPVKVIPYTVFLFVLFYLEFALYHEIQTFYGAYIFIQFTLWLLFFIPVGFVMSLIYFYKPWRDKYYPKYNAVMANILSFGLYTKRCKITPDQLYCNSFIIPRFNNISLEYEMTGDFQKYITNIDIIALKKLDKKGFLVDDAYKFKAVFLFNNLVETGLLKVKYI